MKKVSVHIKVSKDQVQRMYHKATAQGWKPRYTPPSDTDLRAAVKFILKQELFRR